MAGERPLDHRCRGLSFCQDVCSSAPSGYGQRLRAQLHPAAASPYAIEVKSVADVQQAMKDTDNEDIYVPGALSGLTGGVQKVSVTAAGSGYTDGDYTEVDLTGGSGSGAKATIKIDSGAVDGTDHLVLVASSMKN